MEPLSPTAPAQPSRPRLRWLSNLLTVVVSVAVSLLAAELLLRLIIPAGAERYATDPKLLYRLEPGRGVDARGYRNAVALGHADIVAIGDSQTFGDQATREKAWPQQLADQSGRAVYNMGVGGYGPVQYRTLTDRALTLSPQLIVWGLYLGNDIFDAYYVPYESLARDRWAELRSTTTEAQLAAASLSPIPYSLGAQATGQTSTSSTSLRLWLRRRFRTYALLGDAVYRLRERLGQAPSLAQQQLEEDRRAAAADPGAYVLYDGPASTVLTPAYRANVLDLADPRIAEGLRLTLQLLTDARAAAQAQGTKLLVAIIPTKESAYAARLEAEGVPLPDAYRTLLAREGAVRAAILDRCAAAHLECLDLLPSLSAAVTGSERLYPSYHDGHPLPSGYATVAQAISGAAVERNLLTP